MARSVDLSHLRKRAANSALVTRPSFNNPPGLPRAPKPRSIFATAAHRNKGAHWIDAEIPALPDDRIIATAVELGMPRWAAEQCRTHGGCRFNLVRLWCTAQDAAEGDPQAKEQIDYIRWSFQELRRAELIADRPDHTVGLWER